ncbi:hypothetical protein [Agaricicola taiwanensis]|uniref:hypothetical protein n=1 Tax=Agaricicola taiwanensis TaxID=591372 RepID=UPI00166C9B45|nr:hypothetical protein [Agaricicola taiwanensis]
MNENVQRLLNRLKAAQRDLVLVAARTDATPPDSLIRKIADLEVAIGAVEHLLEEDSD